MICWGDVNNCGILLLDDTNVHKKELCRCPRDSCVKNLPLSRFLHTNERELKHVFSELEATEEQAIKELGKLVKIRSISGDPLLQSETLQIMQRLGVRLNALAFTVDIVEIESNSEQKNVKQFALFANHFSLPTKNVLLIYGNVDVPRIGEMEQWTDDPFEMTERNGRLYGKGLATTKAPILCWLSAIEAWMNATKNLPINIRMIIDSSYCSGSEGLRALLETRKDFLAPVDFVLICTNQWIADTVPLLTNSQTGYVYFALELEATTNPNPPETDDRDVEQPKQTGREPMSDLIVLLNCLVDKENNILIKNIHRGALPIQHHDWLLLNSMECSPHSVKWDLDVKRLVHEDSRGEMLLYKMCKTTLSIHSIKASQNSSFKTNLRPAQAVATFSVKLVPQQIPAIIIKLVRNHLDIMYRRLKCTHKICLRVLDQLAPLYEPKNSSTNKMIKAAFERCFHIEAVLGDNISICFPMLNVLRKYCMPNAHALPLPFWSIHINNRMGDESMSRKRLLTNRLLCATVIFELSKVAPICKCNEVPNFCTKRERKVGMNFLSYMQRHSLLDDID